MNDAPALGPAFESPAIGRNAVRLELPVAKMAEDHTVSARTGKVAVQFYGDGAKQVSASLTHQRPVVRPLDQAGNGTAPLCGGESDDFVFTVIGPELRERFAVAAVGERPVLGNDRTNRLEVLEALKTLGKAFQGMGHANRSGASCALSKAKKPGELQ